MWPTTNGGGGVRCELCVTAIYDESETKRFYSENAGEEEHLSLRRSIPCDEKPDVSWCLSNWSTPEDLARVEYRADSSKQAFYNFACPSPPLIWQRTVARKYPNLNFVLTYDSANFSGYVSYARGRRVGTHGDSFWISLSISSILQKHEAQQKALRLLRPYLRSYLQHRLYRYPDGLRLPQVKSHFQQHQSSRELASLSFPLSSV